MVEIKNYISVLLCLIIGLFTLKSALVMTYYICFTDSFIETYCINQDKPELNCDGKCYLSQLLDKSSADQEDQKEIMLLTSVELVFYIKETLLSSKKEFINFKNLIIRTKLQNYFFDFHETLIKPPESLT